VPCYFLQLTGEKFPTTCKSYLPTYSEQGNSVHIYTIFRQFWYAMFGQVIALSDAVR
jgi:hypothetical protein